MKGAALSHRVRAALSKYLKGVPVLLYHRVYELESDPLLLSVTPANFASHLEILRERLEPISLSDLVRAISKGKVPSRGFVVTFDDGYRDNLTEAKPILETYKTPATVFVATGYVTGSEEFWWDELERVFLTDRKLPSQLKLQLDGHMLERQMGSELVGQVDPTWDVTKPGNPSSRHSVYRELLAALPRLHGPAIRKVMSDLRQWAGLEQQARATHLTLKADEVAALAAEDLVEVGAHTINHPALSGLSADEQQREISGSKEFLESLLGRPIRGFAYPFGTLSHYDSASVDAVRSANFLYSCSNFTGEATRLSDPFQIPRVLVRNWGPDEFRTFLAGFRQ